MLEPLTETRSDNMQVGANFQNYGAYAVAAADQFQQQADQVAADSGGYAGYMDGYEVDFSPQALQALGGG